MRRASVITIGLVALALLAGLFLPVYTDEIGWRFQERAGFDGVDKFYSDLCGANTLAAPPVFMMPVRWYSWAFNSAFAAPFYVRLSGVLYALGWLAMLVALIRRIAPDLARRHLLTILAVALMGLGVMPLLLVWSRPEQPILLAITGALLMAFGRAERRASEWLRPAMVLALAIIALSYHFKALVLIPAFAGCLWFSAHGRAVAPRAVMLALLGGATWLALRYWFGRLGCPGDPLLVAVRVHQSLGPGLLLDGSTALAAVWQMLGNIDPRRYARLIAPSVNPMSQWLAPDQVTQRTEIVGRSMAVVTWYVVLLLGLVALVRSGIDGWHRRRLDPRLTLALTLLFGTLGWMSLQLIHNAYEATFVLPLLMLVVVLALASAPANALFRPMRMIAGGFACALPISLTLVAIIYAPSLRQAFAAGATLPQRQFSVGVSGYARDKPVILRTARACGIVPGRSSALLVDDLTYFPFMANRLPQHQLGVLNSSARGSITDPVAYLRRVKSEGMIVQCRFLPPALRARAKQDGGYCCLGPPGW